MARRAVRGVPPPATTTGGRAAPPPIARVHRAWQTPWAAIALAAALGIGYVSVRTFEQLADSFILGIWPFYALAVGAVFILRKRRPGVARAYRTVGYPVVPAIFLIASLLILGNALVEQPVSTAVGFGIILAGVPVYFLWRVIQQRTGQVGR